MILKELLTMQPSSEAIISFFASSPWHPTIAITSAEGHGLKIPFVNEGRKKKRLRQEQRILEENPPSVA